MLAKLREQIEGKLPAVDVSHLRKEFVAWWNGEDRPEHQAPEPEADAASTLVEEEPKEPDVPPSPEAIIKLRILVAETLWGEGYVGPGDFAFLKENISQFGLTKEHSVCLIGSGLAGAGRDITKEYGAWITAYENATEFVDASREQCAIAGLAKRVEVNELKPSPDIPSGKFHLGISLDRLYAVEDKSAMISSIAESLASGGSLLITDYVREGEGESDISACFDDYWGEPHLADVDAYASAIKSMKLDLRSKQDITGDYIRMINEALPKWKDLLALANEPTIDGVSKAFFARYLAREAMMWQSRLEALSKDEIKVYRFLAMKGG